MQNNKIYTYVGFARRAGKFKAGLNAIKTVKKGVELLLLCHSASPNAIKEAEKLILSAFDIGDDEPTKTDMIYKIIN